MVAFDGGPLLRGVCLLMAICGNYGSFFVGLAVEEEEGGQMCALSFLAICATPSHSVVRRADM